jgi:amino acid adenylation domain-containing protein
MEWNDTQAKYPQSQCIHQLFEAQVERTPDAVAVVFENQQLTYQQLNCYANQLAHHLQALGVGPEVLVGICVERSLEMVVGLLGILKAGGAYVPLDPAYPHERQAFMLQDSQVAVLLTQTQLVARLQQHEAKVLCLDTDWETINRESRENLVTQVLPTHKAYVLYTSGSTGQPKGVIIEHRSTVAFLAWARKVFTTEVLAGVLASTSICFDLSVFELFVPLSWGGQVILVENALHLPTLPAVQDITLINTVPSAIAELLRVEGVLTSVRTVNLAGELLQNRLVQQLYQQDMIQQVFNLYGPSEDTTYSTFALIEREATKPPTIGCPIANTQIYILDSHLQPVPVGVPGELHISSVGLARGYLNHPDLTAGKFIPNPFSYKEGARLYKTGDLACYLPDGNIEFVGRLDHQVKIRGFRIELGEVEAVLAQHPQVRETVVIARSEQPDDQLLVAYVVPNQEAPTVSELRGFLKQTLPDYMMPSVFVMLEALPLTPNGKIDRRALPTPDSFRSVLEEGFVAPRNPTEEILTHLWAEVLGLEQVGIHDNFFELGGHSLLATKLISRFRQVFSVELPLRTLFKSPTIAELGELVVAQQLEQANSNALEEILSNVNELSDDEVKQQLLGEYQ